MEEPGLLLQINKTAFLELGHQTGADVEQLALLFTWNCAGRMLSAIIVGIIMDKFHPEMQLGMISLLYMICTTVVPLTRSYIAVAVNIAIQGFYGGYLSTGGTSIMFYLFSNRGDSPSPYIQANYFTMAVGSFISPFIVKPFLSTQVTINTTIAQENINASSDIHLEIESKFMGISIIQAGTFYPYMVMSTFIGISVICCFIQFSIDKYRIKRPPREVIKVSASQTRTEIDSVILMMLVIAVFCLAGAEVAFSGLLYAYAVKARNWDIHTANMLLTMFWTVYMVGRGLGIFVVRFVRTKVSLVILISIMVASMTLMVGFGHLTHTITWIASAGMSLAGSMQLGIWMVLGNEFFVISGRLVGLLMTSVYLGAAAIPAVMGHVFKNINPQWMPHILLALSLVLLADYITIEIYGRIRKSRN